jgi:hypothetical protein
VGTNVIIECNRLPKTRTVQRFNKRQPLVVCGRVDGWVTEPMISVQQSNMENNKTLFGLGVQRHHQGVQIPMPLSLEQTAATGATSTMLA